MTLRIKTEAEARQLLDRPLCRLHSPKKAQEKVKLSAIPESAITQQIRSYLRVKRIPHYKAWQGLGSEKGVSDIVGVLPGGRALFIEVKGQKGKLSPYQERFLETMKAAGAKAFVARSSKDVEEELAKP